MLTNSKILLSFFNSILTYLGDEMKKQFSNRIISTPSSFAKEHYLYVQETGSLQSIEPHISKRDNLSSLLFFVVTQGSGSLTYQGKKHSIHTGDCIFINCLDEYSHESSLHDPWVLSWVHFYGTEAIHIYKHYEENEGLFLFHPSDSSSFINILKNLFTEQSEKSKFYEQKCHKYLTDIVTACYFESAATKNQKNATISEKILAIRAYLDDHFAENIDLDFLASHFFISKFHLSREFKKATGLTLGNYLNSRRINEAKQLLRFTKEPIGSIAVTCGIPDVNYFTKVFTKYESMTPSAYRKRW